MKVFVLMVFLFISNFGLAEENSDYRFFLSVDYMSADQNNKEVYKSEQIKRLHFSSIANFHSFYSSDENILTSSEDERKRVLNILLPHYNLPNKEAEDIVLQNTIDLIDFTNVSSKNEMNSFLKDRINHKSPHEKVLFLGNLLSTLADNYDYESLENDFDEVLIDDMEMITAMKELVTTGEELPKGVCRHMHQFALRVADQIGMENSFGVGFNTTSGAHRTLVLNIPGKRNEVIQLNYGELTSLKEISGVANLTQNSSIPSTGIRFRLYNGNDESAIILPSEDGSILNLMTGGENSDLGAAHKDDAQVAQVGVQTPYGTFRVFGATNPLSSLESVVGVGLNKAFNFGEFYTQKIGLSGFQSKRSLGDKSTLETTGVYLNSTTEIHYNIYTTKTLNLKAFNKLHLRASLYCSGRDYDKCVKNHDIHVADQYGLELRYRNKNITNTTTIMAESQVATSHATFKADPGIITPALSFSNKLQINYNSNIYSEHNIDLVNYDLGTASYNVFSLENAVGLRNHDAKMYHRYQKSLDKSAPIWLPGAEEKTEMGIKKSFFNKRLTLSGSYTEYETIPGGNAGISIRILTN